MESEVPVEVNRAVSLATHIGVRRYRFGSREVEILGALGTKYSTKIKLSSL